MKKGCLFFLLFSSVAFSQKRIEKTLNFDIIKSVEIDADNCFELEVSTHAENKIVIEAKVEGEYQDDLLVSVKEFGNTLRIGADFQPMFKDPNDKLSAHKVVSISMKIWIPEAKKIAIYGNYTNTKIQGTYADLRITLNDGMCSLKQLVANASISTLDGDIHVSQVKGNVDAITRHGIITRGEMLSGNSQLLLKSINGDIYINKSE